MSGKGTPGPFDFRLPNVLTMSGSGHKFGESICGTGWVIFRQREDLAAYVSNSEDLGCPTFFCATFVRCFLLSRNPYWASSAWIRKSSNPTPKSILERSSLCADTLCNCSSHSNSSSRTNIEGCQSQLSRLSPRCLVLKFFLLLL
jgi:hypothetical protein